MTVSPPLRQPEPRSKRPRARRCSATYELAQNNWCWCVSASAHLSDEKGPERRGGCQGPNEEESYKLENWWLHWVKLGLDHKNAVQWERINQRRWSTAHSRDWWRPLYTPTDRKSVWRFWSRTNSRWRLPSSKCVALRIAFDNPMGITDLIQKTERWILWNGWTIITCFTSGR